MNNLDRWLNSDQLRRDHDAALRLIDRQGLIRCTDRYWIAEAKGAFLKIIGALWDDIMGSTLSLVYCYDQSIQPTAIAKCDGYSSVSERQSDGQRVASVGISLQALHAGEDYAVLYSRTERFTDGSSCNGSRCGH